MNGGDNEVILWRGVMVTAWHTCRQHLRGSASLFSRSCSLRTPHTSGLPPLPCLTVLPGTQVLSCASSAWKEAWEGRKHSLCIPSFCHPHLYCTFLAIPLTSHLGGRAEEGHRLLFWEVGRRRRRWEEEEVGRREDWRRFYTPVHWPVLRLFWPMIVMIIYIWWYRWWVFWYRWPFWNDDDSIGRYCYETDDEVYYYDDVTLLVERRNIHWF